MSNEDIEYLVFTIVYFEFVSMVVVSFVVLLVGAMLRAEIKKVSKQLEKEGSAACFGEKRDDEDLR